MPSLRIKRGTRAQVASAGAASGLKQGELYHVTDEDRVDLGTGLTTSVSMAKKSEVDAKEPTITAGTTNQFWRGDKSWTDFATTVRASVLTGLSTATNAVITATDTVLAALGKLQKQVTDNLATLTGHTGAASGAHAAAAISNTAAGNIVATTVQAAINELDTEKVAKSGDTMTGNLNFSGTGLRLTGDFSNATFANRLMFQTSTTNGNTNISAIPNGTGTTVNINAINASDPTNASVAQLSVVGTVDARLSSTVYGTGTFLPMTFYTGGTERLRIDASGNVLVTGSGGLGYGVGSGGTVTQATNKSTAVTLNKPTGQITMNAASLAAGATVFFDVNNSLVTSTDNVLLTLSNFSALNYTINCFVAAGKFTVIVKNETGGALAEAVVFNFAVHKGATS